MLIELETAKQLTAPQELELVRTAFAQNASPEMRVRLATLLLLADAFDEVVAVLAESARLTFEEELLLSQAYLARETTADTLAAGAAADRALSLAASLATSDTASAIALAYRGKAEMRSGDTAAARATLRQALRLDPHNKDACKRLATLDLQAGDTTAILTMADELAERGAAHARLFAAEALAHARSGDAARARALMGFDDLHVARQLPPPPGWSDIRSFNAALAQELLAHPGLRYERYGTASALTWRIDAPATRAAPLFRALLDQLAIEIHNHVDRVGAVDHPWARACPRAALLRSWCVITESDGFETWHVHQFGWLSGVYYVQVPESIANGDGLGGCLAFGLPEDLAGPDAAATYGTPLVRPQEGLMLAFPSHSYHRTFPHGLREKRICVAFDLRPQSGEMTVG